MESGSSRLEIRSYLGAGTRLTSFCLLYTGSVAALWLGISPAVCAAQGAAKSFTGQYTGTVGGSPIRMTLQREGTRVTGTYRYVRAGVSLRLTGTWQDNHARLQEIYGSQTPTGVFTARVRADGGLEGTWTKPDGSGALSFYAQPLAPTTPGNAQLRRDAEPPNAQAGKSREIPSQVTRSSPPMPPAQQRSRSPSPEEILPSPSGPGEEFLEAIRQGDTAGARSLLEQDMRLNPPDKPKRTALAIKPLLLILACSFRNDGLEVAAFAGIDDRRETVQLLLARGADVNVHSEQGYTPLMYAAASWGAGNPLLNLLLDAGADVNARNMYGGTALMMAAGKYGHVSTVQLLVKAGGDINLRDKAGHTALWTARARHAAASVQALQDAGAVE